MGTGRRLFDKTSSLVPLISIVLGLLVGAAVMAAGGYDPIAAYRSLLDKVFGSKFDIGETLRQITPLIFTGLSVAFAFRTGLFNIGAEGQFIMGMTGATVVGVTVDLPAFIHAPLAIAAGAMAGGLWGALTGYLKARRGVNEVISSIMLNWIALYLSNFIIRQFLLEPGQQRSRMIHESASVSLAGLSKGMDYARMHIGMLFALAGVALFYVLLWRTKQGYELRAVGHNPEAARYAGMKVSRTIIKAMFISGLFAGLAGTFESLGVFHYEVIAASSPGYGFDGIAVSLLGGNTPLGILLAAALFGALTYGSAGMSFGADVPTEIARIVIGAVIFFVASHGIVRWLLKPDWFRKLNRPEAEREKGAAVHEHP
ncbi:ABC transporter permease [Paenibacillus kobensis]|uniref:ABC transporter permease n=1 Tax=Paenibacillus kobensis TaxID=59841 RepID=UPI000FDB096E|nr:ABC transporter permease [Paenibacillus kobensis]